MRRAVWIAWLLVVGGCHGTCAGPAEPPIRGESTTATSQLPAAGSQTSVDSVSELSTRLPAPARMVAIGDLHGDLPATRAALRLAGAIDDKAHWNGGALVVVQTGDQIDRGDDDREVVELFDQLATEASAAGGAVIAMLGNHEIMNVQLNFDYVTEGGFKGFDSVAGRLGADEPALARYPASVRPRVLSFAPGGPYAMRLSKRQLVVAVGDTVFVHGGLLPKHLNYGLARMQREVERWMTTQASTPPSMLVAEDSPVWARRYSAAPEAEDCKVLQRVLDRVHATRMVVGHTVQRGGISPACDGKVWRIDVGMSRYYGGPTEVLEIAGDKVRPLKQSP